MQKKAKLPKNAVIARFFKDIKSARAYAKKNGKRTVYVTDKGNCIVI